MSKGFFYLPYRCHHCDNYFQVSIGHFDSAPLSPRCPQCGTTKTRLADVDEVIE